MSEAHTGIKRGQFIRDAVKGSVALVGAGGVLASLDGVAFARSSAQSPSDITILQTGFIAETLAVRFYSTIVNTYSAKLGFGPANQSYFTAALADEQAHLAAWKAALGPKYTPTGFTLEVPVRYLRSRNALAAAGRTLEEAFVSTYMGAIAGFSSGDLRSTAAGIVANEATHYSLFEAILPGGEKVLPAFGPKPITTAEAAATLKRLGFLG